MSTSRIFVVAAVSLLLLIIILLNTGGVEINLIFAKLVVSKAVLVFASALAGFVIGLVGRARLGRKS